ncbi:glutathione S-transferase family protein [Oligoflexus tunisiensis]|uniref:glutathione S-transferase family protein n=1 Tax=Oligoflexus tunisiensis TaxID=708132 RepID=UPI00114D0E97|nr:glutathione S-transferase family protein [Oligoflexus tunisiensis]
MKLYFTPRTRATRLRWLLEELEEPYELVRVDASKQGDFPALVDGDVTLFEASAICLIHLADRFPERHLAPPPGSSERGQYYQWMSFAEGSLEPVVMKFHEHAHLPEEKKTGLQQENLAQYRNRLNDVLKVVETTLKGREVLVGEHFTAADLMMAAILHLAHTLKLLEGHPLLEEYLMKHTKRPACRKAVS